MLVLATIVIFFKQQQPSICQVGYFWEYPRSNRAIKQIEYLLSFSHVESKEVIDIKMELSKMYCKNWYKYMKRDIETYLQEKGWIENKCVGSFKIRGMNVLQNSFERKFYYRHYHNWLYLKIYLLFKYSVISYSVEIFLYFSC